MDNLHKDMIKQNTLSIFQLNERLDDSIMCGLLSTFCMWFIFTPALSNCALGYIFVASVFIIHLSKKLLSIGRFKERIEYKQIKYEGDIESLIFAFMNIGLFLDRQIGSRYSFKSKGVLLRSLLFVRDENNSCTITGNSHAIEVVTNYLNKTIS